MNLLRPCEIPSVRPPLILNQSALPALSLRPSRPRRANTFRAEEQHFSKLTRSPHTQVNPQKDLEGSNLRQRLYISHGCLSKYYSVCQLRRSRAEICLTQFRAMSVSDTERQSALLTFEFLRLRAYFLQEL